LTLDGAGEAAEQRRAALLLAAQEQHLTGVRIGRTGLGVEVVAVVPHRHQSEVVHRGEGGGAGADDDPDVAPGDGEEGTVAAGRSYVRSEHDVPAGAEGGGQG